MGRAKKRPETLYDIKGIVKRTLNTAKAAGKDYEGQRRAAVNAVMSVRPDLTPNTAREAVDMLCDLERW